MLHLRGHVRSCFCQLPNYIFLTPAEDDIWWCGVVCLTKSPGPKLLPCVLLPADMTSVIRPDIARVNSESAIAQSDQTGWPLASDSSLLTSWWPPLLQDSVGGCSGHSWYLVLLYFEIQLSQVCHLQMCQCTICRCRIFRSLIEKQKLEGIICKPVDRRLQSVL